MSRSVFPLVAGVALIASCTSGVSGPTTAPSPPAVSSSQTVAASAAPLPAPTASAIPSAAASAPAPEPRQRAFVPGTFSCREKVCKAGKEVCCEYGDDSACARRASFGQGSMLEQKLEPQFKACTAEIKSKYSLSGLAYCDDSSDCPANQVCCVNWGPGSGNSHTICVPAQRDKSNACELAESCVEGQPCATANTHCESGACVLNEARVRCAGVVCQGAAPVCCAMAHDQAPKCTTAAQCKPAPDTGPFPMTNACSGPSSCPKGMVCQRNIMSTYCSGMVDGANARLVCETDKDCPADHCKIWGGKGKPKCVFDTDFSYCTCP